MKWFKHDSNAHSDTKLRRIKHKYGMVGYGLYWYCVELIAGKVSKENITFELEDDAEIIAIDWNLDQLKVEEMMRYFVEIGLFESSDNTITCLKLAKRLDDTNAKNPEIKSIINKIYDSGEVGETPSKSEKVGETQKDSDQIRLDKIRLDKNNKSNFKISFHEYLEKCRQLEVDPIPEDHLVFTQNQKAGIPYDWIAACWYQFKNNHLSRDTPKKYKDWRTTFHNYVKRPDWHKVWWIGDEGPLLTTNGKQQMKYLEAEA